MPNKQAQTEHSLRVKGSFNFKLHFIFLFDTVHWYNKMLKAKTNVIRVPSGTGKVADRNGTKSRRLEPNRPKKVPQKVIAIGVLGPVARLEFHQHQR